MKLQQKDLFSKRWRNAVVQKHREVSFQIQLVSMLRWCLRPDVRFWHPANGGYRDDREAAKLKAMGVLPGCADLEFHWCDLDAFAHKIRRVLHLELKVGNRPQSEHQVAFELAMRLLGDSYHVVHTIDEAIAILGERGLLRNDVQVGGRRWR
jgi:hypothetical protein